MRQSIGRTGSRILELLLPSTRAQACTAGYCVVSGSRHRCCKFCPGTGTVCLPWVSGGSCTGVNCPN
jgi:hypothetical protein